ncbi:hypothetical protein LTR78_008302 [Recurvomyces mirabilis]|uniref:WIBG Mago-binding domain-containing protein n=1 Tax=Recurvomyces mirabilis TaxID=574656 RepID=A0AAE0TR36_9PEZI|nr:hypothetical protein LTR78_008302 [Recurvomyces mirabilis]KAK5158573.1 hypothetical protein LTS14_003593 [Recurvomyces mirabilis]
MPPKPKPITPTNNSGIHQLSNGSSIIPSSLRPDGSLRKEIKVRPGYKPAEDVEVYKNRTAEGFRNRGKGAGVPGANDVVGAEEKLAPHKAAAAAGKNAKRREARRKAAASDGKEDGAGEDEGVKTNGNGYIKSKEESEGLAQQDDLDPEVEAAKEARKLAKKLRQARELKEKKEQGGDLLPEQFAKVIKIQELIRQLEGLGFDGEGERKVEKGEKGDGVEGEAKSAGG